MPSIGNVVTLLQGALTEAQAAAPATPIPTVPPVVAAVGDPLITDAPGGLTSGFVYGGNVSGGTAIAPWLSWQGQDDTPIGVVTVGSGFAGPVKINLGALAAKAPVQIGVKAGVAAVTVANDAKLNVVYDDGSVDALALAAQVGTDASTAYMLIGRPTWNVSRPQALWLRFDQTKRAVMSATLTLSVTKTWTAGSLNVVRFTAGYLPQPALAPFPTGTTLFQTECWEDTKYRNRIILPAYDQYAQRKFVDTPEGRALELWFDPRQSDLLDQKIGIFPEANECWSSFDLMVMPGANKAAIENGKLPGFSTATTPDDAYIISSNGLPFPPGTIGTLLAGNGGSKVHGNDGWSDRGDWLAPHLPPHPQTGRWGMSSYVYTPDFDDYNGLQMPWSNYGTGMLDEGRWYHLEHRLKVNSVPATGIGNRDGEAESRIDGKLALLRKGLRLRDAPPYLLSAAPYNVATSLGIRNFWLCAYHGGHAFPTARVPAFRMRNFKVVRVS